MSCCDLKIVVANLLWFLKACPWLLGSAFVLCIPWGTCLAHLCLWDHAPGLGDTKLTLAFTWLDFPEWIWEGKKGTIEACIYGLNFYANTLCFHLSVCFIKYSNFFLQVSLCIWCLIRYFLGCRQETTLYMQKSIQMHREHPTGAIWKSKFHA